jgi:hypothetical protein
MGGSRSWKEISPDLTRKTWEIPASVGKYAAPTAQPRRRASSTPSPRAHRHNRIWAGTDDSLIHVTADGAPLEDVTPPDRTG